MIFWKTEHGKMQDNDKNLNIRYLGKPLTQTTGYRIRHTAIIFKIWSWKLFGHLLSQLGTEVFLKTWTKTPVLQEICVGFEPRSSTFKMFSLVKNCSPYPTKWHSCHGHLCSSHCHITAIFCSPKCRFSPYLSAQLPLLSHPDVTALIW